MQHVADSQGIIIRFEQVSKVKGKKPKKLSPEDIFYLQRNRIADEIHGMGIAQKLKLIIDMKGSNLLNLKTIPTKNLYESTKWTEFFTDEIKFSYLNSPKLEKYNENTSLLKVTSGFHATYSDFLMLPNYEWGIKKLNEKTYKLIHNTLPFDDNQKECSIPASYVIPAIRKPSDANAFTSSPNSYVLNLPHKLDRELNEFHRKYIYWAENELEARWEEDRKKGHKRVPIIKRVTYKKNRKGETIADEKPWFSHSYDSKCSEKRGHLFFLKRLQPSARRSLSFYTEDLVSVNHGIFFLKDKSDKLYASWTSSSLFLISYFQCQQIVHKDYYKVAIKDFDRMLFPKSAIFTKDEHNSLIKAWQLLTDLSEKQVPFLPQQLGAGLVIKSKKKKNPPPDKIIPYDRLIERVELDKAWLRVLDVPTDKIDKTINEIYDWLIEYMETR